MADTSSKLKSAALLLFSVPAGIGGDVAGAAFTFGGDVDVAQLCNQAAADAAESGLFRHGRRRALSALELAVGVDEAEHRCVSSWKEVFGDWGSREQAGDDWGRISEAHKSKYDHEVFIDAVEDCWSDDPSPREAWHQCCGEYPVHQKDGMGTNTYDRCRGRSGESRCCAFGKGSKAHLAIPALMEIEVSVLLQDGRLLSLGQDGFLRKYGTPTILWPAGYLLALFLSDNNRSCSGGFSSDKLPVGGRVLELGTGIGAPSIAVAGASGVAEVLATDIDPGSLRLVAENAAMNGLSDKVIPLKVDWHSDEDIDLVKSKGPFHAIVGSSLLIEAWEERFWFILQALVGQDTVVVLVHTTGAIHTDTVENKGFKVTERVSGDEYSMLSSSGDSSDFEVVVLILATGSPFDTGQCNDNAQRSDGLP